MAAVAHTAAVKGLNQRAREKRETRDQWRDVSSSLFSPVDARDHHYDDEAICCMAFPRLGQSKEQRKISSDGGEDGSTFNERGRQTSAVT